MSGMSTRCWWLLVMVMGGAVALFTNSAYAQITPDRTLPNNSSVTLQGKTFNINGGTQAGHNLFHSFQSFSVPTGNEAHFNNAVDIQNIFSRVTGGSVSNIDGSIRANGTANLFLINPSGIIFGKNASLNVGGSFLASTASSLKFADGKEFSAIAPQSTPLLTISVPIGLQYGSNPGNIVNQSASTYNLGCNCYNGGLQVPNGKTLGLIGGNVSLEGGGLVAPSGRVELGGVAQLGIVGVNVDGNNLRLNFPDGLARADVSLTNKAHISVGFNPYTSVTPAGTITISTHNLDVLGGSSIDASNYPGKAGEITINTTGAISSVSSSFLADGSDGAINIQGKSIIFNTPPLTTNSYKQGGPAGSIIEANRISLYNAYLIAKNININVNTGSLTLANRSIIRTSSTFADQNAGNINISTRSISLTDGAYLDTGTSGDGRRGNITISADSVMLSGVGSSGIRASSEGGDAGNINIRAKSISLTDGAYLDTGTSGDGRGGNITIDADSMIVSGVNSNGDISGLSASIEVNPFTGNSGQGGQGGDIKINAHTLRVTDGAFVGTGTLTNGHGGNLTVNANNIELINGGQLFTTALQDAPENFIALDITGRLVTTLFTSTSGKAGDIAVSATSGITISGSNPFFKEVPTQQPKLRFAGDSILTPFTPNSGVFANTLKSTTGQGGSINITTGQLTVRDGGQVTASNQGTGNAGDININARSVKLDNGSITTTSLSGQGGNIDKLQVQDLLVLRNGSQISTTAAFGQNSSGNGGNININAPNGFIIAIPTEDSHISANAFKGKGGNIDIKTTGVFGFQTNLARDTPLSSTLSSITASSQFGINGTVQINISDVDPSPGLVQLPTELFDASSQIDTSCNPGSKQQASSFTITGRGGLPPNPKTEPLSPDAVQVDWVSLKPSTNNRQSPTRTKKLAPPPIVPATGWVFNGKGEVTLISSTSNTSTTSITPASCAKRY